MSRILCNVNRNALGILQTVQNRAMKLIYHWSKFTLTTNVYKIIQLLNVDKIILTESLK